MDSREQKRDATHEAKTESITGMRLHFNGKADAFKVEMQQPLK